MGGSDDNFLQPRIAKFLKLPVLPIPSFKVLVGNGNALQVEGLINDLQVHIQNTMLQVDVYLLPVMGADLILGTSWLATLGAHIADYKNLCIQFVLNNKLITLNGDSNCKPHLTTVHQLHRLYSTKAIDTCYALSVSNLTQQKKQGTPFSQTHLANYCDQLQFPEDMSVDLQHLLLKYHDVFALPSGLPPSRMCDHAIPLISEAAPVKIKPYRYPHSQKSEIEKMVTDMLQDGIIEPSTSPFSSPVLLVKKKDGSWRFCTDYRALNAITVKDSFPIPTVDELLDELFGARFFSKMDLRSGYHQILLKPEDRFKTAFRTHSGHYQWLVMPFGLSNAPATFQALMNQIFRFALRKFVLVFFDDILIYSVSWEDHLRHLEVVLDTLKLHQLFAKFSKCSFGLQQVDYLGHIVSAQGVAMDNSKVQAILQWPIPGNLKQLRGFLGLSGYYRRFIRNYASLAKPLTELLKKDNFHWTVAATDAFAKLKLAVTTAPVLQLPDFSQPFTLETDASGLWIGAVLSQSKHPIAYFSKKMSPRMQSQSAYIRELYAVTEAVTKFRHYLIGHKFIIKTDHQALKHLNSQVIQTPEQQKWLPKLLGFDFTIEYKPGCENVIADGLSRCYYLAFSTFHNSILQRIKSAQDQDNQCQHIIQEIQQGNLQYSEYTWKQNILWWKNKIVVPPILQLQQFLLQEFHSSLLGGHAGQLRTFARIALQFYWPGMRNSVKKFIKTCDICQRAKHTNTHPAGLLQPLPIPNQIWEDISMDFICGLPVNKGYSVIFVVVDRLSKYGHFIPMKGDFTSQSVAHAFITNIVRLHGIPRSIVSDRDKAFTSKFWQTLFHQMGTSLSMSSAYHPETDGQTGNLNKGVEHFLRCFIADSPKSWVDLLPWAEFSYNTAFHTSLGMTPFQAVYGREPPSMVPYQINSEDPVAVSELLLQRDKVLQQLKQIY